MEAGPQDFTALLLASLHARLPHTTQSVVVWGIGSRLEPRPFSRPPSSAGELLRTL